MLFVEAEDGTPAVDPASVGVFTPLAVGLLVVVALVVAPLGDPLIVLEVV